MIELREHLSNDLKTSMKAREANKVGVYRLIFSEIKQKEVDGKKILTSAEILAVLEKMIKQRRDSIAQFEKANRQDLINIEKFELDLISTYLPAQLTDEEICILIDKTIANLKAQKPDNPVTPQSMGVIIASLRTELAGKADMGKVSALVKQKLS